VESKEVKNSVQMQIWEKEATLSQSLIPPKNTSGDKSSKKMKNREPAKLQSCKL